MFAAYLETGCLPAAYMEDLMREYGTDVAGIVRVQALARRWLAQRVAWWERRWCCGPPLSMELVALVRVHALRWWRLQRGHVTEANRSNCGLMNSAGCMGGQTNSAGWLYRVRGRGDPRPVRIRFS